MVDLVADLMAERHRAAQLRVRAALLNDVTVLWGAIDLSDIDASWGALMPSLVRVVEEHRANSAQVASNYYKAARAREVPVDFSEPADEFEPPGDVPPDRKLVEGALTLAGPILLKKGLARGQPNPRNTAMSRIVGEGTRVVLGGGRDTMARALSKDKRAKGWERVTSSSACEFCQGIADEGISAPGGGFEAHAHCGCSARAVFA